MNGNWIETYTGRKVYPLNLRVEDIDIRDIAHALSLMCRFNGHCPSFYSVAQHSVLVAQLLRPELKLAGLLHDASEAYLCDLPTPVKAQMPTYQDAEIQAIKVIGKKFGIEGMGDCRVHIADKTMTITEAEHFKMHWAEWNFSVVPIGLGITIWTPQEAEFEFLKVFNQLTM